MSHFLDHLTFFKRSPEPFSGGHGVTTSEDRRWEDGYRKRWQHDKIVRSTHGVNCTGSNIIDCITSNDWEGNKIDLISCIVICKLVAIQVGRII